MRMAEATFIVGVVGLYPVKDRGVVVYYSDDPRVVATYMGKGIGWPAGCKGFNLVDPKYLCTLEMVGKMVKVTVNALTLEKATEILAIEKFSVERLPLDLPPGPSPH